MAGCTALPSDTAVLEMALFADKCWSVFRSSLSQMTERQPSVLIIHESDNLLLNCAISQCLVGNSTNRCLLGNNIKENALSKV